METISDASYGVVPVCKKNDIWQVLLIHQISYRGANDTFWIFPKGHAEVGESESTAALRELTEETGITEVVLETSKPISIFYSFIHENTRINKTVTYWIGYCKNQDTEITQPHEIKELRWCSFEEAEVLLAHQNSKDVLEQVKTFLSQELSE